MPLLRNTETLINVDDINMLTNLYNIFYVTHGARCWLTPTARLNVEKLFTFLFSILESKHIPYM